MRFTSCLPESWWEFALKTAVHVYNRTPMSRLNWRTPYELYEGKKPKIDHFRVFGCGAYVFLPDAMRKNKLSSNTELMIFLGYENEKNYVFMRHTQGNVVHMSPNAVFNETFFPKCPNGIRSRIPDQNNDEPPVPNIQVDVPNVLPGGAPQPPRQPPRNHPSPPSSSSDSDLEDMYQDQDIKQESRTPSLPHTPDPPSLPSKGPSSSSDTTSSEDDEPQDWRTPAPDLPQTPPRHRAPSPPHTPEPPARFRPCREIVPPRRPGNVYGKRRNPVDILRNQQRVPSPTFTPTNLAPPQDSSEEEAELSKLVREGGVGLVNFLVNQKASGIIPVQYKDVLKLLPDERKSWLDSMLEELKALKDRNVYELVDLPKGRKAIKNRWVYTIKPDSRKRSRLVAKGFSQIEGVDFDDLFSPVVRYETVRLLLSIAALEDFDIYSVDVKTTYLYGDLDEEIYMEQPEGFRIPGSENKVWRLRKALYGLKQAGLSWWKVLTASMTELGFKRCHSDAGVYIYICPKTNKCIYAVVYVDNVFFMGPKRFPASQLNEAKIHGSMGML